MSFGWGLGAPDAVALIGTDLFVANYFAHPGHRVDHRGQRLHGSAGQGAPGLAYKFDSPQAMAVAGDDLFVANSGGNSVTEVNASTGALVEVIWARPTTSKARRRWPCRDDLFVANQDPRLGHRGQRLHGSAGEGDLGLGLQVRGPRAWRWPAATCSWPTTTAARSPSSTPPQERW